MWVGLTLKFLNSLLLKIANNVSILIQDVLQMQLFRKLLVIVVSSNKLWKIGLAVNICGSKDVATKIC